MSDAAQSQTLIGPFKQILTMQNLPEYGPISDEQLEIITNGGIIIEGQKIYKILTQEEFIQEKSRYTKKHADLGFLEMTEDAVLVPGFIDTHTHMCYAGSRHEEYARRIRGESYLEIAKKGGGILSTVQSTRKATQKQLMQLLFKRGLAHLKRGITTCEVKSGYGLDLENELKMLRVIKQAKESRYLIPDLIATCLAAHTKPQEFETHQAYLDFILAEILPEVKKENLSGRVDIFVEEGAFTSKIALDFVQKAKEMGFTITVHADQFTVGGSEVASQVGAISADHLEASGEEEIRMLKEGNVIATVLPGASMGLGVDYPPARKILDMGLCMVIATDWNPGSAPMGDLLVQAAVLGAHQKLSIAETLSAITNRAAKALSLTDRGELQLGKFADLNAFPCSEYQEIFYNQGVVRPFIVWKRGTRIF